MSADADELGGTMTATTPDPAATVRLLLEAFLTGDVETVMSYVDDDIEWTPPSTTRSSPSPSGDGSNT